MVPAVDMAALLEQARQEGTLLPGHT